MNVKCLACQRPFNNRRQEKQFLDGKFAYLKHRIRIGVQKGTEHGQVLTRSSYYCTTLGVTSGPLFFQRLNDAKKFRSRTLKSMC